MHPNTFGRDHRSTFTRSIRWSASSRSASPENPFRWGGLIVALTAALIATTGCGFPTSSPPPAPDPMTLPEPNLRDCDDLVVGDRNSSNCVTTLRFLLNTRGAQLPATGLFRENTLDRVRQFQRARRLPATGVVGDLTKKALYEYPPKGAEWDLRTECVDLYAGAEGQCVQSLQRLLIQYGEKVSDIGKYGPETTEAVRRFQHKYNLSASGVTDSETKEKLYDHLSSVAPPDWRAEVSKCPGSDCGVYLDHTTVASIVEDFDKGTIVRGLIEDVVVHFACAWFFKATGLQVVCERIGTWITGFFIEQFRKARADQKCVQISFEATRAGFRPARLNQTEHCPS